jgi:sterol desaturase/sphingolipid hydroxylase (fatty acid hydroxylase superfamily)
VVDLVLYAIPAFVLLLAAEWASYRHLGEHHADEDPVGYDAKDTATSLSMGLGNLAINVGWKAVVVAAYAGLFALAPWDLPDGAAWAWVLLFVLEDHSYYWFHRTHHQVRVLWASHVAHHSSQHYNLSTALRQTWTPMTALPFWLPLPLIGFEPWQVLLAQSWSLVYQFWLHTERVGRMPRWFERVFNTPSHHRVHHGSNEQYLDRNHGGILIVWDRLYGTWEPEGQRVRYGLTSNIASHHPVHVAFHEFAAIWQDVRRARSWRDKAGYVLRGPGWAPPERAPDRADAPAASAAQPAVAVEG